MDEIPFYSPSPQPSPLKGEGVFLTFYETMDIGIWNLFVICCSISSIEDPGSGIVYPEATIISIKSKAVLTNFDDAGRIILRRLKTEQPQAGRRQAADSKVLDLRKPHVYLAGGFIHIGKYRVQ